MSCKQCLDCGMERLFAVRYVLDTRSEAGNGQSLLLRELEVVLYLYLLIATSTRLRHVYECIRQMNF